MDEALHRLPLLLRAHVGQFHPAVIASPRVESLFAGIVLPAAPLNGLFAVHFAQNMDDFLGLMSPFIHG